jgi:hypothetical protein
MKGLLFAGPAATVLAALLHGAYTYHPTRRFLRRCTCDRDRWSGEYPADQLPLVVDVLHLVCRVFLLSEDDVFRLRPDDRLLAIYKAAYPYGGADALELESLARELRESYGVDLLAGQDPGSIREMINECLEARKGAV